MGHLAFNAARELLRISKMNLCTEHEDSICERIQLQLSYLIGQEAEKAFQERLAKEPSIKTCYGQYSGPWNRLSKRWNQHIVSNEFVIDCMQNKFVIDDNMPVEFYAAGVIKNTRR
jgi:hypothetical protein